MLSDRHFFSIGSLEVVATERPDGTIHAMVAEKGQPFKNWHTFPNMEALVESVKAYAEKVVQHD